MNAWEICDILNLLSVNRQIKTMERNRLLAMHTYKKWLGSDGYWRTYIPKEDRPHGRMLCKKKSKEELDNAIIFYLKEQLEDPTVKEVFDEWNDRKLDRGQIKPSTHLINKQIFNRFYISFGLRRIRTIKMEEWEDFLCEAITKYHLTAKAFSNLKGITKGFLKRAKKRKIITMDVEHFFLELDVSDNDFKKRRMEDSDEVFSDEEVGLIMNYILSNPDPRNLGIALMFVTGIRVGELAALKHEDFNGTVFQIKRSETRRRDDETKTYIYYVDDFPKTPAGFRSVVVPSNYRWIIEMLKLVNPGSSYIFLDKNGNRMNTVKFRKRLYLICNKVGIKPRSPHKIRKTYGSILLDNGLDAKFIEGQMGHTSITCTENYYHKNRRSIDQKQEIIDSVAEFSAK